MLQMTFIEITISKKIQGKRMIVLFEVDEHVIVESSVEVLTWCQH